LIGKPLRGIEELRGHEDCAQAVKIAGEAGQTLSAWVENRGSLCE
jgi:hypothetical protein